MNLDSRFDSRVLFLFPPLISPLMLWYSKILDSSRSLFSFQSLFIIEIRFIKYKHSDPEEGSS